MFNQRAGTLSAEAGGDCVALAVEQARTRPVAHILLGPYSRRPWPRAAEAEAEAEGPAATLTTGSVAPPVAPRQSSREHPPRRSAAPPSGSRHQAQCHTTVPPSAPACPGTDALSAR